MRRSGALLTSSRSHAWSVATSSSRLPFGGRSLLVSGRRGCYKHGHSTQQFSTTSQEVSDSGVTMNRPEFLKRRAYLTAVPAVAGALVAALWVSTTVAGQSGGSGSKGDDGMAVLWWRHGRHAVLTGESDRCRQRPRPSSGLALVGSEFRSAACGPDAGQSADCRWRDVHDRGRQPRRRRARCGYRAAAMALAPDG